ncbi:MAG: hypothetical protein QNJ72_12640 [Pleurocapsa sp. MO_226.B13]|nr:hypothetical protein [Pleurocapsa sp. MO_226.B13]
MNGLHFLQWLHKVEKVITSSVNNSYPRDWDEDFISRTWMNNIRQKFSNTVVIDYPKKLSIGWDVYKADGSLEEKHGDIAILVNLTFPKSKHQTQNPITGIAFLEAKRRYPKEQNKSKKETGYEKLDWSQLETQISNISNHQVLLYDNESVGCFNNLLIDSCFFDGCILRSSTQAIVIPTPHVLACRSRSRKKINPMGLPLSYQLCCRYLQGYDLDFREKLVSDVKSGAKGGIKYLLVADVVHQEGDEASSEKIEINKNKYNKLRFDNRN